MENNNNKNIPQGELNSEEALKTFLSEKLAKGEFSTVSLDVKPTFRQRIEGVWVSILNLFHNIKRMIKSLFKK